MAGAFQLKKDCVVIRCRVTPNASRDEFLGFEKDPLGQTRIRVKVSSVPEKGKANSALIKFLSKSLGLPKSALEVISGPTSRLKKIRISGDPAKLMKKLKKLG